MVSRAATPGPEAGANSGVLAEGAEGATLVERTHATLEVVQVDGFGEVGLGGGVGGGVAGIEDPVDEAGQQVHGVWVGVAGGA